MVSLNRDSVIAIILLFVYQHLVSCLFTCSYVVGVSLQIVNCLFTNVLMNLPYVFQIFPERPSEADACALHSIRHSCPEHAESHSSQTG